MLKTVISVRAVFLGSSNAFVLAPEFSKRWTQEILFKLTFVDQCKKKVSVVADILFVLKMIL